MFKTNLQNSDLSKGETLKNEMSKIKWLNVKIKQFIA